MKITNRLGIIFLSAFLILTGLGFLAGFTMTFYPYILGALAIAAGCLLLVDK